MNEAEERLAAGDPQGALECLQAAVRANAADAKQRVFLFQLLCVLGQWSRALNQLQVCGELDAGTLAMVNTYRAALQCEAVRERVMAGQLLPHAFGQPQPWIALLAEALQAEGRGEAAVAARLRQRALTEAPATPGRLNGEPFEWIADADSRLGPVLECVLQGRYLWVPFAALARVTFEPPADLRDLVWAPAQLEFGNGGGSVALVPTRYAGSTAHADPALWMARRTEWLPLGDEQFRGLGQRVLSTDGPELGLLEVREIQLGPAAPAG